MTDLAPVTDELSGQSYSAAGEDAMTEKSDEQVLAVKLCADLCRDKEVKA